MLNEKTIKEAESNVREYLEKGSLKKVKNTDENVYNLLKKNTEESLKVADFLYKNNLSWLWVIVCSYYSMFYSASAVLYKSGYKIGEKSPHKMASDALIVFVRNKLKTKILEDFEEAKKEALELAGLKADDLIESFEFERGKRGRFQYEMTDEVKKSKAETSLNRAKLFTFEIEKLLI